jgi:hypothetical protein
MDFVFDRTVGGRAIKNLTVVDDATHEAVAIVPERARGGIQLTRALDQLFKRQGLLAQRRCQEETSQRRSQRGEMGFCFSGNKPYDIRGS